MNRFISILVVASMLAINPAAWADSWRGQGSHAGSGQWHGSSGQGHGNSGWHGNSGQWHGNAGWSGNSGWHGNNGWHGGSYHAYPAYKPYYYRPYPAYKPYYAHYPYRPYYPAYPYYRPYYRPVGYPYPYYGGYYYPYQHKNNNNSSDWPAYLAGGLIIGALVTNAYNNSRTTVPYSYSAAPATPIGTVQGRRLLRDLNGKCYDVQTDANGNELRTELPASQCNW